MGYCGRPLCFSVFVWFYRVLVLPEAALRGAGLGFRLCVGGRRIVLFVMPGEARLEHFEVDVAVVEVDRSEDAVVLVALGECDTHLAPRDESRQELTGRLSERLPLLRRIDPLEADFVLGFGSVKHGDRVAIRHFHHAPCQRFVRPRRKAQARDKRYQLQSHKVHLLKWLGEL